MRKKKLILLLTLTMAIAVLGACSKADKETPDSPSAANVTEQPTPSVEAAAPEATATPEATTTPETTPSDAAASDTPAAPAGDSAAGDLSDDLFDFQFSLNGEVYTLPCQYSELSEAGWSMEDIEGNELEAGQYTLQNRISNGDIYLSANIVNTGDETLPMEQCRVGKLSLDSYEADSGAKLVLSKGITYGSTYDEVTAAFGEPTDTYDSDVIITLTYKADTYSYVKIQFDAKTKTVNSMEIENMISE